MIDWNFSLLMNSREKCTKVTGVLFIIIMEEIKNSIIIVPDVHCRNFYKPVLQVKNKPIIFLGDYMDPYRYEGTSDENGIANLEEIFDYARNNKNVTLLVGNHKF